jgi:hypothetical protein
MSNILDIIFQADPSWDRSLWVRSPTYVVPGAKFLFPGRIQMAAPQFKTETPPSGGRLGTCMPVKSPCPILASTAARSGRD